jgi:sec-independent protein translocase protein TatB
MFEVGFSELLLIMALALLVLGPQKLPKVVAEVGRWMGRARAMARQFREQLEVEAAESQRPPPPAPTPTPTDDPVQQNTPDDPRP